VAGHDDLTDVAIGDSATDADIAALREALHQFNFEATGHRDGRGLSCIVRDRAGRLLAGIDGFTWGGYAHIEYLWVGAAMRGTGIGTRLLSAAEAEARHRGCLKVVLSSHSFQAPDLYRSLGYREVGTTLDTPIGFTQTFFEKSL
jgi:ribosomal protein S18 acetylase RimI-like enzyme